MSSLNQRFFFLFFFILLFQLCLKFKRVMRSGNFASCAISIFLSDIFCSKLSWRRFKKKSIVWSTTWCTVSSSLFIKLSSFLCQISCSSTHLIIRLSLHYREIAKMIDIKLMCWAFNFKRFWFLCFWSARSFQSIIILQVARAFHIIHFNVFFVIWCKFISERSMNSFWRNWWYFRLLYPSIDFVSWVEVAEHI